MEPPDRMEGSLMEWPGDENATQRGPFEIELRGRVWFSARNRIGLMAMTNAPVIQWSYRAKSL